MIKKKSSLEDFFENYIKNKKEENGSDSFEEYRAKNVSDYDSKYRREVEGAYGAAMRSRMEYGSRAEKIHSSGLSGSGYAERQSRLAEGTYEKRLEELLGERQLDEAGAQRGYAKYLDGYEKRQGSLMKSVRQELIKNGIINTERAYEYALGAGLSDERAREVSVGIYTVLRDKIIADLIDRVITYRLDVKSAVELARQYGLDNDDTAYVKSEAERLRDSKSETAKDVLDELEDRADRVTGSFK